MAKKTPNLSRSAQERIKGYEAKTLAAADRKAIRRKDNLNAILVSVVAVVIALGAQGAYFGFGPGKSSMPTTSSAPVQTNSAKVPDAKLAENRTWTGSMNLNGKALNFTLDGKKAPQAVANFVTLVRKGFYNNTSCHRLTVQGIYVLQCGDPTGTGTGTPGYQFGPIENAPVDDIYPAATLAMARGSGNGYSNGSQFFIVYNNSSIPHDTAGGYTVFGKVTKGMENVLQVAKLGVTGGGSDGKPVSPAVLSKLTVK